MSDLMERLLAIRGQCWECGSTGLVYELDGEPVRMIPCARLDEAKSFPCAACKISEAEWIDLKLRANAAEQIGAAQAMMRNLSRTHEDERRGG